MASVFFLGPLEVVGDVLLKNCLNKFFFRWWKDSLDSKFFTDKTTLIPRKNWLVLSLPVCVLKGLTIVRFFTLSKEVFTADFTVKGLFKHLSKDSVEKYVARQQARGEERSLLVVKPLFHRWQIVPTLWKFRSECTLCALWLQILEWELAHPFSSPPPLRGRPTFWHAILTVTK